MRIKRRLFVLTFLCVLFPAAVFSQTIDDPTSLANINEVRISHLDLDLTVDFNGQVLSGNATLHLDNMKDTDVLILDTRGLTIHDVTLGSDHEETNYALGEYVRYLGRPLTIAITTETEIVTIEYSTSPEAGALQWVKPAQTAGGEKQFLYSQSQFNLARTWIPLQDSPAVRMTYSATVRVPEGYLAVMSAENPVQKNDSGVYTFEMPQPIPSYLMALAVGDLDFRSLSERTGVYAESPVIDAAAYEFAGTEQMVQAAEALYGPYQWGQYDMLILPPSFPFGGMENPRLTFTTPTIITGDRSLVALIAHELAHSWSGNLVTNATWEDFWLNEGFTTYFERRITEATRGRQYAQMLSELSYHDLFETVKNLVPKNPDTALKLDLESRNPDDAYSGIPYVKGMFFLRMLEEHFGRERWDAFLNDYFGEFRFQSVTTEQFVAYLRVHLLKNDPALEKELRIREWIYEPGIPENCSKVKSAELTRVEQSTKAFLQKTDPSVVDTTGWTTHHWRHFLEQLPDTLSEKRLTALDGAFHLTKSNNAVIQREWYTIAARNNYAKAREEIRQFLADVGRVSLIRPIYTELSKYPEGLSLAENTYNSAKSGYHQMTRDAIEEVLQKVRNN